MSHFISSLGILKCTPLFKKGVSTNIDNYRPISVLPVALQKLLEHTVHHQLYSFGNEQKLLSRFQCGFRSNYSTEFAATAFSHFLRHGMDQGLLTGTVFIDLRKAFDPVDHDLLINKLESYGLFSWLLPNYVWGSPRINLRSLIVCFVYKDLPKVLTKINVKF